MEPKLATLVGFVGGEAQSKSASCKTSVAQQRGVLDNPEQRVAACLTARGLAEAERLKAAVMAKNETFILIVYNCL